jgi:osmotically-inducible protein OsmY
MAASKQRSILNQPSTQNPINPKLKDRVFTLFEGQIRALTLDDTMNTFAKIRLQLVGAALAASLIGCAYDNDPNRSTGRVIDDKHITGRVADALKDSPVYKFPHVRVSTFNGVVQLSGFVVKDEQKSEAAELARHVPGVTEVINNISLAPIGQPGTVEPVAQPRDNRTNTSSR